MGDCSGQWVRHQIWHRVRKPVIERLSMGGPESEALDSLAANIDLTLSRISDGVATAVDRDAKDPGGD